MSITYQNELTNIDWEAMKAVHMRDSFDNGRTPAQLKASFQNSSAACLAFDQQDIIGTARVLSDGVCNAYIVDVWTLSAYRRRGIARTMIGHLLLNLRGQHVYLFTDDALDFYHNIGFKERGVGMEIVVGNWLEI